MFSHHQRYGDAIATIHEKQQRTSERTNGSRKFIESQNGLELVVGNNGNWYPNLRMPVPHQFWLGDRCVECGAFWVRDRRCAQNALGWVITRRMCAADRSCVFDGDNNGYKFSSLVLYFNRILSFVWLFTCFRSFCQKARFVMYAGSYLVTTGVLQRHNCINICIDLNWIARSET